MKQVLETTEEVRDRVREVAERSGLNLKQTNTAILKYALPSFESGKLTLGTPVIPVTENEPSSTQTAEV